MIKHIVMWKLKDPADSERFRDELIACRGIVPGMREFEVATRADGLEANMDVLLYSVFEDKAALDAYQVHPRHKQAGVLLGQLREARTVLDYEI